MVRELLLLPPPLDNPDPPLKPLLALDPRLVTESARGCVLTSLGRNGSRDVVVDDPAVDEPVADDEDFLIMPLILF